MAVEERLIASCAAASGPSTAATRSASTGAYPDEAALGRSDWRRWLPVRSMIVANDRA